MNHQATINGIINEALAAYFRENPDATQADASHGIVDALGDLPAIYDMTCKELETA